MHTPIGDAARTGSRVWASAAWRAAAVAWLDDRLAETGVVRTGDVEQPRVRPWATVLRVPTDRGALWLKAAGPATAFEVGLYAYLHATAPDRVLAPVAADTDRGWIVLPDGGATLGDRLTGDALVSALEAVLPRYARLQRELAPHADALVGLGVVDMRPAVMPARFDEALDAVGRCAEPATVRRLADLRQTYAGWCHRLAAAAGPASLDHGDLHPWNVLPGPDGDDAYERVRFYDWGDSVVAHPFTSMLVTLRILRHHLDAGPGDPRVRRVRDAYLEAFTDLAPRAELVGVLDLARRVGVVTRALTWQRAVDAAGPDELGEYAGAPLEWMVTLLDAQIMRTG